MYLTLADDNYAVRVAYVRATGERPGGVSLLTRPRHQVERALVTIRKRSQVLDFTGVTPRFRIVT